MTEQSGPARDAEVLSVSEARRSDGEEASPLPRGQTVSVPAAQLVEIANATHDLKQSVVELVQEVHGLQERVAKHIEPSEEKQEQLSASLSREESSPPKLSALPPVENHVAVRRDEFVRLEQTLVEGLGVMLNKLSTMEPRRNPSAVLDDFTERLRKAQIWVEATDTLREHDFIDFPRRMVGAALFCILRGSL